MFDLLIVFAQMFSAVVFIIAGCLGVLVAMGSAIYLPFHLCVKMFAYRSAKHAGRSSFDELIDEMYEDIREPLVKFTIRTDDTGPITLPPTQQFPTLEDAVVDALERDVRIYDDKGSDI